MVLSRPLQGLLDGLLPPTQLGLHGLFSAVLIFINRGLIHQALLSSLGIGKWRLTRDFKSLGAGKSILAILVIFGPRVVSRDVQVILPI